METRRIMFNEDNTHQFYEYCEANVRLTPEIAKEYISQYIGTQITDYLINVNSLNSSYPSKVFESYDRKYLQKFENGVEVDYTKCHGRHYYESFIEDGYDMYAHWIELLKEIGIRSWLSFRMNDCHNNADVASFMLCDWYHEHPELRRFAHHGATEYYDNCLDYAKEEIRSRMLAYIDEALDRYDVESGIELDFIREEFCFSLGNEYNGRLIMTEFIREVRKTVDKYAEKRGKEYKIIVRLPRSPEDCLYLGLDVMEWVKQGLVNIVVASPRWCPTDNDIPVEFWKQILAPYNVEFAAACELILRVHPSGEFCILNTHETTLASAFHNLCAGSDFTYLFNYMRSNVTDYNNPENTVMYSDLYKWDNYQHLIRNAGAYETAIKCVRRHIPTYQDLTVPWKSNWCPFPAECKHPRAYVKVRIRTGDVPEDARVLLILGCSAKDGSELSANDFDLWINTHKISELVGTEEIRPAYTLKTGYVFELKPEWLNSINMLEVSANKDGKPFDIDFSEIRVIPVNAQ